jgi:hypothetical protein
MRPNNLLAAFRKLGMSDDQIRAVFDGVSAPEARAEGQATAVRDADHSDGTGDSRGQSETLSGDTP